jgi:hypothetical protein
MQRKLLGFAVLAYLSACSSNGVEPDPNLVCSVPLRVAATNSTTPSISWSPQCHVNQVVVHGPGPEFTFMWAAFATRTGDQNPIVSPVQYGVLPDGTTEFGPAQPLVAGQTYIIDVSVRDSTSVSGILFVGSDTIVP